MLGFSASVPVLLGSEKKAGKPVGGKKFNAKLETGLDYDEDYYEY